MVSFIKFLVVVTIIILVIRSGRKKNAKAGTPRTPGRGPGSFNAAGQANGPGQISGPDIALWRKAASELSGKLRMPYDKSGLGLSVTGKIEGHPFQIDFTGEKGIFYSLTLPYAPAVENHQILPIRCVADQAIIGENKIFLLCRKMTPEAAVIKEMAAHAGRLLMTIPFEEEAAEDRPESAFLHRQDTGKRPKTPPVVPVVPVPVVEETPEPVVPEPEEPVAAEAEPEPVIPEPEPVVKTTEPEEPPAPAASPESAEADALSPESLAGVLFRSTLPGPEEKEYFASLVGRSVEWSGTVRMAYEISSDFVFGNGKAVKVQMDICSVNGKYGRQTLRATAVFPPENYKEIRAMSNKTIRFRGSILKLEPFSREIYLSKGELL